MSIFTTQMAWEFRVEKLCWILWMWETLKFVIVPPIMLNMFSTMKTFSERQSRVLPNVHICTCNRAFQHWRSLALAELNRVRIISINSVSTYFEHIFHQQIKNWKYKYIFETKIKNNVLSNELKVSKTQNDTIWVYKYILKSNQIPKHST